MVIVSNRLIMRRWESKDRDKFYKLNSDPRVMEYFPKVLNRDESDEFLKKIEERIEGDGFGLYAVDLKESNEFIGYIGLNIPRVGLSIEPCIEIGWRLKYEKWGNGYAIEGARAVLDYAFNILKIERVYSFTAKINNRSENVMKKLGMKRDRNFLHPSIEKGDVLEEHILYYIDSSDYRGKN